MLAVYVAALAYRNVHGGELERCSGAGMALTGANKSADPSGCSLASERLAYVLQGSRAPVIVSIDMTTKAPTTYAST